MKSNLASRLPSTVRLSLRLTVTNFSVLFSAHRGVANSSNIPSPETRVDRPLGVVHLFVPATALKANKSRQLRPSLQDAGDKEAVSHPLSSSPG